MGAKPPVRFYFVGIFVKTHPAQGCLCQAASKMKDNTWTDEQLIAAIKAGGDMRNKAWEYTVRAWRGVYIGIIAKSGGTPHEVDAALSYAVLDVDKQVRRPDFALRSATLRSYFIGSLVRHWARLFRQGKVPPRNEFYGQMPLDAQEISPEEAFIQEEQRQKVHGALAQLGERCKTILTLFAAGHSWTEIAQRLNIGLQNAKNTAGECKQKLREGLQGKL